MKLLALFISTFVFLNFSAQKELKTTKFESKNVGQSTSSIATYEFKVDEAKLAKKKVEGNTQFKNNDASYYDNYIKSLESKRNFILTDSTMTSNARKEGWFEFADKQIEIAKEEKLKLDK